MKVLFISNDPSIFEAESPARGRMREYAAAFGELHIISPAKSRARYEREGALVLHPLKATRLLAMVPMISKARRLIREEGIEIVSAQDPFEYGWVALQAVHGSAARLHIQIHTDFLSPWFVKSGNFRSLKIRMPVLNRIRRHLADKVLPQAHGIRVVSKRIQDSLKEHYATRVVDSEIIPIGASIEEQPPVALPDRSFASSLMTVSRLEPEKRVEDILMAVGRLAQRYPSLGLFVVGDGRERKRLEKLAHTLGLSRRVIFTGWRADAPGLMRSASAYIQASAYEGYGVALIEAALAKVPIITTDVGIVGEVFRGYEEVLSSPVADPAALAVHIAGLIDDHQARHTFVMNAEHAARSHLATYANRTERFASHLASVIKETP